MSGRWDGLIAPSLATSWPMLYFGYLDLTDSSLQPYGPFSVESMSRAFTA